MNQQQVNEQIDQVIGEIRQRSLLYRKDRPPTIVSGRTAIITDDGLASGFTMMAAVESVRRRRPKEIVVAVPVTSVIALEQVEKVVDKLVTIATGSTPKFYIADFYRHWHDLSDSEVIQCLEDWQIRRFRLSIKPLQNR